MTRKILCIGDVHAPFHHKPSVSKLLTLIEAQKPRIIVQMGDPYDHFSLSRFEKSQNEIRMTPAEEVAEGRQVMEEFWFLIKRKAKFAKCFQLMGNHCNRMESKIRKHLPELLGILTLPRLWEFDGVETINDVKEELVIDGWCFMHGFYTRPGQHAEFNQMNTAFAHTHRGWCMPIRLKRQGRTVQELNCGYIGDPNAKALNFRKQRWHAWTHGAGLIDRWGGRFVPLD